MCLYMQWGLDLKVWFSTSYFSCTAHPSILKTLPGRTDRVIKEVKVVVLQPNALILQVATHVNVIRYRAVENCTLYLLLLFCRHKRVRAWCFPLSGTTHVSQHSWKLQMCMPWWIRAERNKMCWLVATFLLTLSTLSLRKTCHSIHLWRKLELELSDYNNFCYAYYSIQWHVNLMMDSLCAPHLFNATVLACKTVKA